MMIRPQSVKAVLVLQMANLLALDQASRVSGYAIFNGDGELVTYGTFHTYQDDIGERLVTIKNKVAELIEEYNIG